VIRKLYDLTLVLAARPNAIWLLALIAFIESSVFPIPPDVMLIPMVIAARSQAWRMAGIATIASVLGGFAGYAIGLLFFDAVGQPLIAFYGYESDFESFQTLYNEMGAWIVFGAGVTPFPFKVITIASGMVGLDPVVFGITSTLARGLRFFVVAALLWKFGPPIRAFIEDRLGIVTMAGFILLIGGFIALRWIG